MKRKRILIVGIIVVIALVAMTIGISGCQKKLAVPTEEAAETTATETTAAEQEELKTEIAGLKEDLEAKDKEIEEMQEKLQKIDSLFTSGAIQNLSINGTVKEISGRSLTIMGYGFANFVVSIGQEAKIFTEYILPEGAPEEEVWGRTYFDDKEIKTGRKEISLEEIKTEDNVFITLALKSDYTVEGTEVQVSPQDLFNQ